jgi:hypothetical protein
LLFQVLETLKKVGVGAARGFKPPPFTTVRDELSPVQLQGLDVKSTSLAESL